MDVQQPSNTDRVVARGEQFVCPLSKITQGLARPAGVQAGYDVRANLLLCHTDFDRNLGVASARHAKLPRTTTHLNPLLPRVTLPRSPCYSTHLFTSFLEGGRFN
jgi:hypothetical protein